MKLAQGQVWKSGADYYRIVKWARLAIAYKQMSDLETGQGQLHQVSKKEFCRLIKGAELVDPNDQPATREQAPAATPESPSQSRVEDPAPALQTPDQQQ